MLDTSRRHSGETRSHASDAAPAANAPSRLGSPQAWAQLSRELAAASRPLGRATPAVRDGARRVAREMIAAGATGDDVRRALTRAVREHTTWLGAEARAEARAQSHDAMRGDDLLADVLQSAIDGCTRLRHD